MNTSPRRSLRQLVKRLLSDETGGESLEYVLVVGMISIVAISLIYALGAKAMARWTSVSNGLPE